VSIAGHLHSDPAAFSYEAQKLGKDELLGNSLAGPASSSGPGAYVGHFTAATRLSLGSLGEVSRAFAAFTYSALGSKYPRAKIARMKPALESASLRIVPLAIPNPSWAMVANMAATAAAIINDKMGMTTRPMQAP
jgi:hypothetical protein